MYQKVIIIGNLGGDPQMRYTPSGQAVTSFSVATSEKWTGQDGQPQERTVWWRVSVWGKSAENCQQYLKKGSKVMVEGTLRGDDKGNPKIFNRQDGTPGASFELTGFTVKFLSGRQDAGNTSQTEAGAALGGEPATSELADDNIPF